jgi:hypothetical protein
MNRRTALPIPPAPARSRTHDADCDLPRRHFLWRAGGGLGGIALAWLLARERAAAGEASGAPAAAASPYAARPPHFAPRAKRVVHVFAAGGVSHIDTFDHKPDLEKHHGKELTGKGKVETFFGQPGNILRSPFAFARHGRCGQWVSDLLPNLARCVDQLTFIRSMVAKTSNHTPATFQMNTGFTMNGFPSLGAWLSYGLGTEGEDLPAFVVLPDPRGVPAGGSINWTSGFLPATHQGVPFRTTGEPVTDLRTPAEVPAARRQAGLAHLSAMNREFLERHPGDGGIAARLRSYELAARMQLSVPEAVGFDGETEATRRLYGLDSPVTEGFGRNCLLARRLLERGVRFVQIWNGGAFGQPRINWDAHEDIVDNHTKQAAVMDRPLAGLLVDLETRGLLADTLFLWTTEFGRTPITQGLNGKGRDHHQLAFTCFLAGAGVKRGFAYGATDELGYHVAQDPVTIHDLHATVLHLLGLDHTELTYYHNGIQRRLTDVHGRVVGELLA